MKQIRTVNIFDSDLSPQTAVYKGYEYIDDVILDKSKPTSNEYLKIIEQNGFKLGIPSKSEYGNFGLYVPKDEFDKKT